MGERQSYKQIHRLPLGYLGCEVPRTRYAASRSAMIEIDLSKRSAVVQPAFIHTDDIKPHFSLSRLGLSEFPQKSASIAVQSREPLP